MSNKRLQQQPGGRDLVQESQGTVRGGKLKANRKVVMIGGAAVVALIAFVMSRGGKGGASGGSDQVMTGYDSTPYDQYNDIQRQLEDLQNQMDNGQVTPGTPGKPSTLPASPKPPVTPAKPKPPVKPLPPASKPKASYVTIKKGDSLSAIAKRAGISMTTLKKLNPTFWTNKKYKNGNLIWAGGKVRVK